MPISIYKTSQANIDTDKQQKIKQSINRANKLEVHEELFNGIFATVSHTSNCALGKNRLYVDDNVIAIMGGLLVDEDNLPWKKIIEAFNKEDYQIFADSFNAQFSILAYFKDSGKFFCVSDRYSQFPVYYSLKNNEVLFSSSLATFFDCLENKTFNEQWLYEFILFNLPINSTTPILDVYRMPAATVLSFHENMLKTVSYASPLCGNIPTQSDLASKEQMYSIFKERFPKYYTTLSGGKYASAITAGYDARLAALFAPGDIDFELYTYGMPNCADIVMGSKIANCLGKKFHNLSFTPDLVKNLLSMANQSALVTGGTLNVLRSTLQWVYEELSNSSIEAATGGIVGDHFFRSDGSPGGNLSICATKLFQDPQYDVTSNPYFEVFMDSKKALDYYEASCNSLESRFDWSKKSLGERHLTYAMYELSTKYYGAEYELAEHYLNLSSPYWDNKVREVAFNTTLSSMTMNANLHNGTFPYWKAFSAFAYILNQDPTFKKIPISGITPNFIATGNKHVVQLGKVIQKSLPYIKNKVFPQKEDPQEDWTTWFGKYLLNPTVKTQPDLLVKKYIDPKMLERILKSEASENPTGENMFIGGKLLTAEFILRKF